MQVTDLQGFVLYAFDPSTGQVRAVRIGDFGGGAGGFAPFRSLNGATAAGVGSVFTPDGKTHATWAMQVTWTGAPTQVVVALEVSLDGSTFAEAARFDTAAGGQNGDVLTVTPAVAQSARANLITLTGTGAAVTVWIGVV